MTETKKMTQREFLMAVIEAGGAEDVIAFAQEAIEKLDRTNETRKNKTNAKSEALNAEAAEIISTNVTADEPMTAGTLGELIGESTQKASAILRRGVTLGLLSVEEVKGAKGKVKGYRLV